MTISISRIHIYVIVMLLLAGGLAGLWLSQAGLRAQGGGESRFIRECVTAPPESAVPESCRSEDAIKATYEGLDVRALIEKKRTRMASTARRIASGELQDPLRYKECIARGECAEVPLLPPDAAASDAAALTPEQQQISAAFWDLAEGDKLTAPVCEYIAECRALHKAGAIDFGF
ncbi:MAG: hypothetical protein HYS17_11905 [Micavibrio aeruginosavorus]|uniref:Uncharacterized protein n=1 Tax=Micavibrio aeruginosavorus TaxID=349221 RepID=A0A7T5R250_9BACT|nr:MAG: hypothetical protein HYS17_11905 [Micavibrio aeruginosavorus]